MKHINEIIEIADFDTATANTETAVIDVRSCGKVVISVKAKTGSHTSHVIEMVGAQVMENDGPGEFYSFNDGPYTILGAGKYDVFSVPEFAFVKFKVTVAEQGSAVDLLINTILLV